MVTKFRPGSIELKLHWLVKLLKGKTENYNTTTQQEFDLKPPKLFSFDGKSNSNDVAVKTHVKAIENIKVFKHLSAVGR